MRTVARIDQELAHLDQSLATIAQEFHDIYQQYLTALGQAVRQQLVIASYHLCTQAYPDRFLRLSLPQRQQLQRSLRRLAKETQDQLLQLLQAPHASAPSVKSSVVLSATTSLLDLTDLAILQSIAEDEGESEQQNAEIEENYEAGLADPVRDAAAIDSTVGRRPRSLPDWLAAIKSAVPTHLAAIESEVDTSEVDEPEADSVTDMSVDLSNDVLDAESSEDTGSLEDTESSEDSPSNFSAAELPNSDEDTASLEPSESKPFRPSHPKELLQWQEQLEEDIVKTLQELSHTANCLLQQSEVLSDRLPEPVLEVAAKADLATETTISPPNLLHLLIETEGEADQEPTMTQLMAIRLRLSEIEFSDSSTTVWRSKIRDLSGRLHKLGRDYQKKQKERSIAEAEAAWRSSWFDDQTQ
jgi:hypothetical protein